MVCVPCIFLPVVLAIYLYFIHPILTRFLPERWVRFLDPILYPTCPARPAAADVNESHSSDTPPVHRTSADEKKES